MIQVNYTGKPARAQNDAMMEAYLDNMDYFYRVNDDTKLQTVGWTEAFIYALLTFDPPNVGVVGPNHRGGNTVILTYEFTSKLHVEIFGFYYPKLYTDWYGGKNYVGLIRKRYYYKYYLYLALWLYCNLCISYSSTDEWISMVYQPNRSVKLSNVKLKHLARQTRYNWHIIDESLLENELSHDISTLNR